MFIRKFILIICAMLGTNHELAPVSCIQLSSTITQTTTSKTINTPMTAFFDSEDNINGTALSWSKDNPSIININETGSYLITVGMVAGAKIGAPFDGGKFTSWVTVNGDIIPGCSTLIYVDKEGRSRPIQNQLLFNGKKGDKMSIGWSFSTANGGLVTFPANEALDIPDAVGIIITMLKIN